MSAMAVHPAAPVIATGSSGVALHSAKGELLNTIKYHEGFMGHKIGPVCSLAMHPLGLLLATGSADSIISIYTQ
jgi:regulator-associated protein of mTOR